MNGASLQEKRLLEAIVTGEAPHALLITAPERELAIAKALEFARLMLCLNPTVEGPCGTCLGCRLMASESHPDFCFLDKGKERIIKVERVREAVVNDLVIRPQYDTGKVYLIAADDLNEQGQNALLKSLEEPPPYARFLLAAAEPQQLLPTIHSRVQTLALHDAATAEQVELNPRVEKLFFAMPDLSIADVLCEGLDLLLEEKEQVPDILERYQSYLRDLAWLLQGGGTADGELLNPDDLDRLQKLNRRLIQSGDPNLVQQKLFELGERTGELKRAFDVNTSLEVSLGQYLLALRRGFHLQDII